MKARIVTFTLLLAASCACRPAAHPADCGVPDYPAIQYTTDEVLNLENWVVGEDLLRPFVRVTTDEATYEGNLLRMDFCCLYIQQEGPDGAYAVRIPRCEVDSLLIWWGGR